MVLWGAAAALAVAGVGLLLSPDRSGVEAAGDAALATAPHQIPASVTTPPDPTAASVTTAAAGSLARDPGPTTAATVASAADRLAGPVPDDEIALAFTVAVPAEQNVDAAVASAILGVTDRRYATVTLSADASADDPGTPGSST